MRRSFVRTLPLLAVLVLGAACDDNSQNNTPTVPSNPITTTETFEGALTKNGAVAYNFIVTQSGTVTATLTAVSDTTVAVGFSLGTWNGTACSTTGIFNDNAFAGATILGSVSAAASLCVRAYDVGKVTDPVTFSILIVRP